MLFQRLHSLLNNIFIALKNASDDESTEDSVPEKIADNLKYQMINMERDRVRMLIEHGGDVKLYDLVKGIAEGRYRPEHRVKANRPLIPAGRSISNISYLCGPVLLKDEFGQQARLLGKLGLAVEQDNNGNPNLVFYNEYGERFVSTAELGKYVSPTKGASYLRSGIYLRANPTGYNTVIVLTASHSPGIQMHIDVSWVPKKNPDGSVELRATHCHYRCWVMQTIEDNCWVQVEFDDIGDFLDADATTNSMVTVLKHHFGDVIPRWEFVTHSDLVDSEYSEKCLLPYCLPEGKLPRIVDKLFRHLESTKIAGEDDQSGQTT
jgi:hypothetical protein